MNRKPIRATALVLAALLALPALAAAGNQEAGESPYQIRIHAEGRPRVVMGPVGRAYLGLQMLDINEELREFYGAPADAGMLVAGVTEDSPAAVAGFKVGDVVTKVGDQRAGSSREVVRAVSRMQPHDTVAVEVVRNGAQLTLNATLGEREQDTWFSQGFGPPEMIMFHRDDVPEGFMESEESRAAAAGALAQARAQLGEIDFSELTAEAMREALEEARERMSEIDFKGLTERLAEAEARLQELEKKLAERREE